MDYGKLELELQRKRKLLREKEKQKEKLDAEVKDLIKVIKDLEKKLGNK